MEIEIREEDGVVILKPGEEIHFDNYREVEEKLNTLVQQGKTNIMVDMQNVSHLYSMTLGMFNRIAQNLAERGGRFFLSNISSGVRKILKATRLDKIIELR
ncbi:MAG: STAS domain-containing protein [bacterium]